MRQRYRFFLGMLVVLCPLAFIELFEATPTHMWVGLPFAVQIAVGTVFVLLGVVTAICGTVGLLGLERFKFTGNEPKVK